MIYRYPAKENVHEIVIDRSRFITTISYAQTTQDARSVISRIRSQMPTANHHVYAFCIGYGNSITEGMSDDGEPSGTAGPPSLAVLRGADIGDTVLVTSRFFGGIKLGTGGLVRAYTESAQAALQGLELAFNIPKLIALIEFTYDFFAPIERLLTTSGVEILDKSFTEEVALLIKVVEGQFDGLSISLRDLTAGKVQITQVD
jgi:uncharacterized YigZ family protein